MIEHVKNLKEYYFFRGTFKDIKVDIRSYKKEERIKFGSSDIEIYFNSKLKKPERKEIISDIKKSLRSGKKIKKMIIDTSMLHDVRVMYDVKLICKSNKTSVRMFITTP